MKTKFLLISLGFVFVVLIVLGILRLSAWTAHFPTISGEGVPPRPVPVKIDFSKGPLPEELQFSLEEKNEQRKQGAKLQVALEEAIKSGQTQFIVPQGHYRFPNAKGDRFFVKGARELKIDAQGSTCWFEKGGVLLEDCEGVTLQNLTVDADPVPFMQGKVLSIDWGSRTVDLEMDPRYQMPGSVPDTGFYHLTYFSPDGERAIPMQWDGVTEWLALGGNRYRAVKFKNNRLFTKPDSAYPVEPGCRAAFSVTTASWGVNVLHSSRCTLENVTVYSSYGYAFHEKLGDGGHQYRRCVIGRRPGTSRLLANARDGFHSYLVKKGPLIEYCDFSRAMDDLIAVHGFFSMVYDRQPEDRRLTIVTPFEPDVSVGSRLTFFDFLTGRMLGQARVVEAVRLNSSLAAAQKKELSERARKAGVPLRDFTVTGGSFSIKLDTSLELSDMVGVMSEDCVSKDTIIRNNFIHDTLSRGMLLRSHGLRVENNRVERMAHSGIAVMPESYYMEGPFVRNVRITGNHVEECAALCYNDHLFEPFIGAIQVANWFGKQLFDPPSFFSSVTNSNVVIRDNRIVRPASAGIFVANVDGVEIVGNKIDHPFTRTVGLWRFNIAEACRGMPKPDSVSMETARRPYFAIFIMASQNVHAVENIVTNPPSYMMGDLGIGPWVDKTKINDVKNN